MSEIDHDEFLPPVVKLSTSPYCTYISSSQYDGTHYNNSTQYGNQYNSTACTSLPLHDDSRAHVSLPLMYITIDN